MEQSADILLQNLKDALSSRDLEAMASGYECLSDFFDENFADQQINKHDFITALKIQLGFLEYLAFANFYEKVHTLTGEYIPRIENYLLHIKDEELKSEASRLKKEFERIDASVKPSHENLTIPRMDSRCCLCRKRVANKTGSHMVPNFLAHPAFRFDENGKRFREALDHDFANHPDRNCQFYGREVPVERILQGMGAKELPEDYAEKNVNQLEYDNEFCSICENRWGVLETAYGNYYKQSAKTISPRLAYLFWLSVIYRMSLGRMGLYLETTDDFSLRKILDDGIIGKDKEIAASDVNLGNWHYALFRAEGLAKEGDKGIFGSDYHYPYVIMANDMIAVFYRDVPEDNELQFGPFSIDRSDLNSWKSPEKISTVDRRFFWDVRDWCVEHHQTSFDPPKEDAMLLIREQERSCEKEIDNDDKELCIKTARLSNPALEPRMVFRKLRRFVIADIRRKEAEARGETYNILEDEDVFLSQRNIDNYFSDLSEAAQCGMDVSGYPFYKEARAAIPDPGKWEATKSPQIPNEEEYYKTMDWYFNEVLDDRGREEQLRRMGIELPEPYPTSKIGRNDPCPCGSGKKYKKCHGR